MIAWLSRPLRSLRDTLEFGDTPRQIALGIALGMVIGLVPKGNLMCVLLCLGALSIRVNLGATMISAVAFSLLSPMADALTHRIGLKLLTWDMLRPAFDMMYDLPLVPWTAFNNTVVLGSFALGTMMFLPTYWISKRVLEATDDRKATRRQPAPVREATATATVSRTYVATTNPIRIDDSREVFQPTIAMAEPASADELAEQAEQEEQAEQTGRKTRIESPHTTPAPTVVPPYTPDSMTTNY